MGVWNISMCVWNISMCVWNISIVVRNTSSCTAADGCAMTSCSLQLKVYQRVSLLLPVDATCSTTFCECVVHISFLHFQILYICVCNIILYCIFYCILYSILCCIYCICI